jgi:hypothetical protein
MHKKLIMACMAIAALAAFVVAPGASGSPVLTDPVATALAVGASVKGTNTGAARITTTVGTIECSHTEFKGTVAQNSGTSIKIEIPAHSFIFSGTAVGSDCTGPSVLGPMKPTMSSKLCIETVTGTDNVKVTGCGSSPVTLGGSDTRSCFVCIYHSFDYQ